MTIIDQCASSQPGCKGKDLRECFVTAADGRPLTGGDIASLTALDSAAGAATIKLTLEHCDLSEIDLGR
jgi:hypothetical protein